ncbi:MAG: PEP-CTERM sorting domain-containing protein [Verrucomicrobiota bacterium]
MKPTKLMLLLAGALCIPATILAQTPTGPAASGLVFFDFGRNDGGINGAPVANPATPLGGTGNFYWNSIGSSLQGQVAGSLYNNFVATDNTSLGGWSITIAGPNNQANGFASGGLASFATGGTSAAQNPDYSLLGDFAVANATGDYFFTTTSGAFVLGGLNPSLTYNFTFFGSRNTSGNRTTTYSATGVSGTATTSALTTSGTGVGTGGYAGNNNTTVSLLGIVPDSGGYINLAYNAASGGFGYLNAMSIEIVPEPSSLALFGLGFAGLIVVRRLRHMPE